MKKLRTHITRFLIVVAALICGYFTLTTGRTAGADSMKNSARPTSELRGPAAIRHLEQTGLYNSLSAAVTAARYQIEASKEGGHEAANPKQGYRTVFTREGVEVRGSGRRGEEWRLGMKLTAYGYGKRKKAAPSADVKAKDDRIEYERRAGARGAISEWYVNRASGLAQGFTIPQAPGTRRAGEKLNLWLKLSGDLKARLDESGQAILLNGRGAGAGLRYDKLHAFDATGREIEARMKLAGDQVRIEVSDEGAIYPVTIDPTLTQQQKLEASDAGALDQFGDCVAISGDTVVVGALFHDGAAGVDQGSAYVFVRSGGVWSQQQKLEASDAAAGDQFGVSVAISGETVAVSARFDDGAAGADQGSAYVFAPANQPPMISAVANSRQQGVPASASAIATVGDPDQPAGSLTVSVNGGSSATVNGVTVSGLTNSDGAINATIGAGCAATDASFTLTVTDNAGATANATLDVTVTANTPPTLGGYPNTGPITAGSGATIIPSSPPADNVSVSSVTVAASAGFTGSLSVDPATGVVTVTNAGPTGARVITVTATDNCGATASGQFTLTVIPANRPPNCSRAFPSVATIWPPNRDMVNVAIQGVTDSDGDPVTIKIDRIKQDEPTDGTGDGHTCPDGAGIGTSTAQVRAERSAQGNGRVYTIYFTASDGKGGSCQGRVTVCAPKSGKGGCRNGGANFDSTVCDTSLK
jgi:hypothetical protein